MVVMGIDSSTSSTGWAILYEQDGEIELVKYGSIKPEGKNTIRKIITILDELKKIRRENDPEMVVIEDLNVSRNMRSTKVLAGLLIAIEIDLERAHYLVQELKPSEWRKLTGIKGRKREEQKKNSIQHVWDKYHKIVNDDEADAICIAEAGTTLEVLYD